MTERNSTLGSLEGKAPRLFLVAGGLFVVFAAIMGYEAFVDSSVNFADNQADVFGPAGFVFGFLGLLGLYPTLADRSPTLTRAGAVAAAIGIVGGSVIAAGVLGELIGVLTEPPAWATVLSLGILVGVVPGYLSFGLASLRVDEVSRRTGLFLLVPIAVLVTMLSGAVHAVVGDAVARFVLASGQAISHLAIGISLGADSAPMARGREKPSPAEVQHD